MEDRQPLLEAFKKMVYTTTPEELDSRYAMAQQDAVVQKNPAFSRHLEGVFANRRDWALCLRAGLLTRGNNTNNLCEAAMRILKDSVFQR